MKNSRPVLQRAGARLLLAAPLSLGLVLGCANKSKDTKPVESPESAEKTLKQYDFEGEPEPPAETEAEPTPSDSPEASPDEGAEGGEEGGDMEGGEEPE